MVKHCDVTMEMMTFPSYLCIMLFEKVIGWMAWILKHNGGEMFGFDAFGGSETDDNDEEKFWKSDGVVHKSHL